MSIAVGAALRDFLPRRIGVVVGVDLAQQVVVLVERLLRA